MFQLYHKTHAILDNVYHIWITQHCVYKFPHHNYYITSKTAAGNISHDFPLILIHFISIKKDPEFLASVCVCVFV